MATLNTKIVLRNDTAENWIANNPVLLDGEVGVEKDTGLLKVGNGTSTWTALDYINKFEAISTATHYEEEAQPIEGTDPVEYETNEQVLERLTFEGKADDVLIIKRPIAGEAVSYTAYIHNGTNWTAMDGNYNADNIYFDADLLATAPIGVITIPETGSTTIAAKGKNLSNVLASILAERLQPTVTNPKISISFTNASKSVEAGEKIIPTYKASLDPGSYTYGPVTGVTASSWTIKDNLTTPNTLTTDTGSFPELQIGDQTGSVSTYSLTASCTHNAGTVPIDNFGDPATVEGIQENAAPAATVSTKLTCYRNYYYGVLATDATEEPLTSEVIRTKLTAGGAYNSKKTFSMRADVIDKAKRMIVAYPANTTRGGLDSVILPNSLNYDAFANGDYSKITNVNVEGANNYTAIPYTVYVYAPTSIDNTEVHNVTLA